ncbi:DUF6365 family protein [Streptosporangium sp. NPDC051022]|uniref:DUF6365 family protein n=1 Tax=Streptosporangium sp. NPDC051022 TaxID=3155752 RepID=UPI0034339A69
MRLLFFAMSSAGYGETLIGMSLARQLKPAGIECFFIIEPMSEKLLRGSGFPYTVLDRSMGGFATLMVDDAVISFRPDAIVLSDYFTFCGIFPKRYGLDPWFIDRYNLPIIPIDIWEWANTAFSVDVFHGKAMSVNRRILEMPAHLRPVPICHLDQDQQTFPFRLWEGNERVSRRTREHLRETFGMEKEDRMVLLAVAGWQQDKYSDENGDQMAAHVPELLVHYLRQLPPSARFVMVGSVPPVLEALTDRTHVIPACSPSRFNVLLGSVDLVLTLNLGATTLARAVLSDIPGVVLTNRFDVPEKPDIDQVEAELGGLSEDVRSWLSRTLPMYPFRMWPLGFHSFLDPIVVDNPYLSTFAHAELLDEPAVLSALHGVLYDRGVQDDLARNRAAYLETLTAHPDTPEVFASAARRVGLV